MQLLQQEIPSISGGTEEADEQCIKVAEAELQYDLHKSVIWRIDIENQGRHLKDYVN